MKEKGGEGFGEGDLVLEHDKTMSLIHDLKLIKITSSHNTLQVRSLIPLGHFKSYMLTLNTTAAFINTASIPQAALCSQHWEALVESITVTGPRKDGEIKNFLAKKDALMSRRGGLCSRQSVIAKKPWKEDWLKVM